MNTTRQLGTTLDTPLAGMLFDLGGPKPKTSQKAVAGRHVPLCRPERTQGEMRVAFLDELLPRDKDPLKNNFPISTWVACFRGPSLPGCSTEVLMGRESMAPAKSGRYFPPYAKAKEEDPYRPRRSGGAGVRKWRQRMSPGGKLLYRQRAQTAEWVQAGARNRGLSQVPVRGRHKVLAIALLPALVPNWQRRWALRQAQGGRKLAARAWRRTMDEPPAWSTVLVGSRSFGQAAPLGPKNSVVPPGESSPCL